jgi:prevent-host-death family protein
MCLTFKCKKFTFHSANLNRKEIAMHATAKDLRFYSKNLLDAVSRGEEVIITYRGKPCAKLAPLDEVDKKKSQGDPLFGIWKDHKPTKDVAKYVRNLRRGRS